MVFSLFEIENHYRSMGKKFCPANHKKSGDKNQFPFPRPERNGPVSRRKQGRAVFLRGKETRKGAFS
jgi:hypothetical protein